jgi:glucokinase
MKSLEMTVHKRLIGIDIGGTKCAVVWGDSDGNILDKIRFDTRTSERGPNEILAEINQCIQALIDRHGKENLSGIGISCGGPLDSRTGRILGPPNLPGWDDVPIVYDLNKKWNVLVALQNDANACALAEWKFGAGRGTKNMIFLTFGTGMGAGLILDGCLYSGTNDLAGEVGHIRLATDGPVGFGKAGSFEGFCSGGGIARTATAEVRKARESGRMSMLIGPSATQDHEITAKDVFGACEAGDDLATEIVNTVGKRLGEGLSILIDILNPECIVIGSIFARSGHLLVPAMEDALHREAIPSALSVCRIVPAELGESLGDVAALSVISDQRSGIGDPMP